MFSPPFFNEFLTVPRYGRTASLTMPSSLDDASLLPPLLPVFLPLVSWIILTTTTSLTVPEYQRGVQGNIIIFIPHHPVQRFFPLFVCFSHSLLLLLQPYASSAPSSPSAPGMRASNRVVGWRCFRWTYILPFI